MRLDFTSKEDMDYYEKTLVEDIIRVIDYFKNKREQESFSGELSEGGSEDSGDETGYIGLAVDNRNISDKPIIQEKLTNNNNLTKSNTKTGELSLLYLLRRLSSIIKGVDENYCKFIFSKCDIKDNKYCISYLSEDEKSKITMVCSKNGVLETVAASIEGELEIGPFLIKSDDTLKVVVEEITSARRNSVDSQSMID